MNGLGSVENGITQENHANGQNDENHNHEVISQNASNNNASNDNNFADEDSPSDYGDDNHNVADENTHTISDDGDDNDNDLEELIGGLFGDDDSERERIYSHHEYDWQYSHYNGMYPETLVWNPADVSFRRLREHMEVNRVHAEVPETFYDPEAQLFVEVFMSTRLMRYWDPENREYVHHYSPYVDAVLSQRQKDEEVKEEVNGIENE